MPEPRKQTAIQYLDLVIDALMGGGYRLRGVAERDAHAWAQVCFDAWLADADPDDVAEFIARVAEYPGKYKRPKREEARVKT